MAISENWFQGLTLASLSIVGALGIAALVNDASISRDNGRISEAIVRIDKSMETQLTAFNDVKGHITNEMLKNRIEISNLNRHFNASQLDVRNVLVGMGIANSEDVFSTAIIAGKVYAFPSQKMAERMQQNGLEFERLTPTLMGIPLLEVKALVE